MMNIDPFDQPGVEEGKKLTFGLMGRPGYEERKAVLEEWERKEVAETSVTVALPAPVAGTPARRASMRVNLRRAAAKGRATPPRHRGGGSRGSGPRRSGEAQPTRSGGKPAGSRGAGSKAPKKRRKRGGHGRRPRKTPTTTTTTTTTTKRKEGRR